MAARTGATFVASTDVMISPFTVLRPTRIASIPISLFVVLSFSLAASAADLDAARKDFLSGKYAACIRETEEAIRGGEYGEDWPLLLTQPHMTTGQYPAAYQTLTNALSRYVQSVRLRLLARDVFRFSSRTNEADEAIDEINQLATSRAWSYRDPANLVALGRCALLIGADPKQVLDKLYDQAKRADPNHRDAYLAAGELALEKDDYQLAARNFQDGLKKFPDDPDFHYGLARAFESGDRKQLLESLTAALAKNPNHIPSLLLKVDHLVDAEEYAEAAKELEKNLPINAWEPEAWAYRAVLAHLRADRDGERASREKGLKFWKTNPQVDHLIGQKLSQKYRFAEGAVYQQRALEFDPKFLPAQTQLAQDKLRLGDEEDGWRLAEAAHAHDAYNVGLYNLVTLKDAFAKFQAVTNENFVVRMSAHEAPIYGRRALHLLERAQTNLCQKYGVELQKPTLVEIFPEQKDFGVRTFGMPDNPGFLGVCFGRVITANSPASQGGHPANWEAVLWHEFCHVVTLQLTKNKMPRWLSDGISVYEEKQANPTWGQAMNPKYREMILEKDELTPVSELSAAFLSPKSPLHLQFAYYESSLVVEFLVSRFGADALKKILIDLRDDIEINAAIEKNTEAMDKIEDEFETFAIKRAQDLAPGLDWKKPRLATAAALERNTARRGGPAPSRNPARRPLNSDTNNPAAGTNSAPKIAGPTLTNTPPAPRVAVVGTDNPIAAATTNASPKPPEAAVTNNFYALNQQARKE